MTRFPPRSAKNNRVMPLHYSVYLLTCLAPSSLVKAQTETITVVGEKNESSYTREATQISSRQPTRQLEDPQSVSVVTTQQLADYQTRSLNEALRFVSGVSEANTLAGTEDGFTRRGFGSNSDGSIYRDGVRSSQGLNLNASTDRVEVLKGSASLLYGIQNPGGVINVISKQPQFQWQRQLSVRMPSTGGASGLVDITGPIAKGLAFRMIAEKQRQHYWRNFGLDKNQLLAPSLQWYGDNASFYLSYQDFQYDIPYDRGSAFIDGTPIDNMYKNRLDDKANHAWGHNKTFNTHYDWQFNPDWSTRLTFGSNQRQYSNNEVRVTQINPLTGQVSRRADANRGFNHKTRYISWDLMGNTSVLGMRHDLLLGVDSEMTQTYRAHQYQGKTNRDFNFYQPQYDKLSPITDRSTEKTANANNLNRIDTQSAYFKDSLHLSSDWIVVVGGRYQHYKQRASHQFDPIITTFNDSGNQFLSQTGIVYKLTPDVSWYSSVSQSFTPSTDVDDNGNTVSPERGITYEMGGKWQIQPDLLATLAFYRIDEKDMSLSVNGLTHLIDKARSSGAELELNGQLSPSWQFSANYSYDRAILIKDSVDPANQGHRLQNAPRHAAALYLSHDIDTLPIPGQIRIGGGGRYVGNRAGDPENSFTLPDYLVADSFIRWQQTVAGQTMRLQLNVNNLFNQHYYSSSGGNLRVRNGETRNMVVQASVDF